MSKKLVWIVSGFLLLRLAMLWLSGYNLAFDEAQYWFWAQTPDFGYYSKPPMVAWVIAATSALGDGEFFIRLGAPLFHTATALILVAIARVLRWDKAQAAIVAIGYLSMPAISLSSLLITTDVPLLFGWSLALLAWIKLRQNGATGWALLLGLALGFAILSKYTAILFVVSVLLDMILRKDAQDVGFNRKKSVLLVVAAAAICLLCLLPNILWNSQHQFVTLGHTADNADWQGLKLHPESFIAFFSAQFGVAGPVILAIIIWRLWKIKRLAMDETEKLLAIFGLPVLVIMCAQSLLSRAHANWAAASYPALILWATYILHRFKPAILKPAIAVNLLIMLIFYVAILFGQGLGLPVNPLPRLKGQEILGKELVQMLDARPPAVLLFEERKLIAWQTYYARKSGMKKRIWSNGDAPNNHYQMVARYNAAEDGERALLVVDAQKGSNIPAHFKTAHLVRTLAIPQGNRKVLTVNVYDLVGLKQE